MAEVQICFEIFILLVHPTAPLLPPKKNNNNNNIFQIEGLHLHHKGGGDFLSDDPNVFSEMLFNSAMISSTLLLFNHFTATCLLLHCFVDFESNFLCHRLLGRWSNCLIFFDMHQHVHSVC